MFEELLKYALDDISSLEHYYEIEAKNILKVSSEGKRQHKLGAMIEDYLMRAVCSSEQERESEFFKKIEKTVLKHIEVISTSEDENKKKITYKYLSEEDARKAGNIKEERKLYLQFADMPLIHGSSTLMMLVTRFEKFFSYYLSELYINFPQKYLDNQKLAFSEITSADIEEIKNNLVFREVDAKMRESYSEWFKVYKSHGMTCKLFEHDLSVLAEIYARRNIIVHNSGIVNPSYLLAVPNSKAQLGDRLTVDENYMKIAFNTVYRIIILMLIESSKMNKATEDEYLSEIFNLLFDFLLCGKYKVCEPAYAELSKIDGLNAEVKLMSQFNRWICIIAEKGLQVVEKEIMALDVSAASDIYKMAKDVLLEKYDKANILLTKLITNGEMPSVLIEEWPLFIWYRASDYYIKLKEDLPDKFGLEREEISEQDCNDSVCDTSSESDTPLIYV